MKNTLIVMLLLASGAIQAQNAPLHDGYTTLLKAHVNAKGQVNYQGFIEDAATFDKYLELLSNNPPQKSWSHEEQMAYWINAYNAFTIKLITKYYPVKSIKDIGSSIQIPFVNTPWDIKFIAIGKDRLDLNNIEHGILRKKFEDPRIHMVLVCASKSCPVLLNEAYEAATLDHQLTKQARAFLADDFRNKISANDPQVSMLFKWYGMDFNRNGSTVRDFVNRYSDVKIKPETKISYLDYDWSLNE